MHRRSRSRSRERDRGRWAGDRNERGAGRGGAPGRRRERGERDRRGGDLSALVSGGAPSDYGWGKADEERGEEKDGSPVEKEAPNFGLSGALAEDARTGNVLNGVVLKWKEPPDARRPKLRWRVYVFKDGKEAGARPRRVGDAPKRADRCGRRGAVRPPPERVPGGARKACLRRVRAPRVHLQAARGYPVPDEKGSGRATITSVVRLPVRAHFDIAARAPLAPPPPPRSGLTSRTRSPYIMDLASTNGTFLNGDRVEDSRYYELLSQDVVKFGQSSREYAFVCEADAGESGGDSRE